MQTQNPYEPSSGTGSGGKNQWSAIGKRLIVLAVVSAAIGLVGTVVGMTSTFNELAASESVSADDLAAGISFSLVSTVIGASIAVLAGIVGAVLVVIGRKS